MTPQIIKIDSRVSGYDGEPVRVLAVCMPNSGKVLVQKIAPYKEPIKSSPDTVVVTDSPSHHANWQLAFYEQQPEYRMLADEMRLLLAEQGITVELLELDYASWQRGEVMADLWLGSVNFAAPGEWSLGCWLLGCPLLRRSICGGDEQQLDLWHQQWQSERLSSEQLMGQVITLGWLQPLFHHWLRLQGPAQARGIRLNNLGWFDFKSAWLTPTMTPTRSPVS